MRALVRSGAAVLLAIVAAVLLAITGTTTSAFTLAATTYILKGTNFGKPFCLPFCGNLATNPQNIAQAQLYVPSNVPFGSPNVINYPASFWPLSSGYFHDPKYNDSVKMGLAAMPSPGSLQDGDVIFGYSEGAIVASQYKRQFNQYYSNPANGPAPDVSFVLIGNGSRPNGGVMQRFKGLFIPGLELSASGSTPTTTAGQPNTITTIDVARQYDGFADFPNNPLNPLADLNATMGLIFVHQSYNTVDPSSQAIFQASYGDTAYYMIPTYPLPLLMPLLYVPVAGPIAADMLDPTLRVLVESAYNREINPGDPTYANIFYFPNPIKLGAALIASVPTGLVIGIEDIIGARTPGTPPNYVQGQGTYGLFGQPVTLKGQTPLPYNQAIGSPQQPATTGPHSASPTILSPLSSTTGAPSLGSLTSLFDPTALTSTLATFTQLTTPLNGGVPVDILSLFNNTPTGSTGLSSLFNPMTVLTGIMKAEIQNLPKLNQGSPSNVVAPAQPPAQTLSDRAPSEPPVVMAQKKATSNDSEETATNETWRHDTPSVEAASDSAPSAVTSNSDVNPAPKLAGPRLNVCRPYPCGSSPQSGTTSTSAGSPGGNPISTAINGVASTINNAVTNTVNAISGSLGQHPATSNSGTTSSSGSSTTGGSGTS